MPDLTLFHGDKGGTGKSFACSVFLDTVYQKEQYSVIDADLRNPDIHYNYGHCMPVEVMALTNHEEWRQFFGKVEEQHQQNKHVVVSLPSQAGDIIDKEQSLFKALKDDMQFTLKLVWVMNRQKESIRLLDHALKTLPKPEKLLIVLNGFYGQQSQFNRWNELSLRKKLLKEQAEETYLPELHYAIVDQLFAGEKPLLPYSDILTKNELNTINRIELKNWLKTAHACFDSIR